MVQTMFVEKCAQNLCNIPLSNNMACQRIADISEGSEKQLTEVRNKRFSMHIDEATDCSSIGHLIGYV
jgi:hypothetical protein